MADLFPNVTFHSGNVTFLKPIVDSGVLHLWFIASSVLCIVSSLAGLILLTTLLVQNNKFKEGTNPLIAHLLAIDSITLAFPTFLSNMAIYFAQTGRPFALDCISIFFFQYLSLCASHWNSVFLALNRFVAAVMPHYFHYASSKRSVLVMITLTWAFSLVLTVPHLFNYMASYGRYFPLGYCGVRATDKTAFAIKTWFTNTIPFCLEGLCYAAVAFSIFRSRRIPAVTSDRAKKLARQKTLAATLILYFLWYLACYLPNTMITTYAPGFWTNHWDVFIWMRLLLTCGAAGTPFVFMIMSKEHRGNVMRVFIMDFSPLRKTDGSSRSAQTKDKCRREHIPTVNSEGAPNIREYSDTRV